MGCIIKVIFEYITSDSISIFITLPCPQEPTLDGIWKSTGDDIMFENMVKLFSKHEFKFIGNGVYYKSNT